MFSTSIGDRSHWDCICCFSILLKSSDSSIFIMASLTLPELNMLLVASKKSFAVALSDKRNFASFSPSPDCFNISTIADLSVLSRAVQASATFWAVSVFTVCCSLPGSITLVSRFLIFSSFITSASCFNTSTDGLISSPLRSRASSLITIFSLMRDSPPSPSPWTSDANMV